MSPHTKWIDQIILKANKSNMNHNSKGVIFTRVPAKKNLPLTADSPVLLDYMSRLIHTTSNLVRKGNLISVNQRSISKSKEPA